MLKRIFYICQKLLPSDDLHQSTAIKNSQQNVAVAELISAMSEKNSFYVFGKVVK